MHLEIAAPIGGMHQIDDRLADDLREVLGADHLQARGFMSISSPSAETIFTQAVPP